MGVIESPRILPVWLCALQMRRMGVGRSGLSNSEPEFPWDLLKEVWAGMHPTGKPEREARPAAEIIADVQVKRERPSAASETTGNKSRLLSLVKDQVEQSTQLLLLQKEQADVARQQLAVMQQALEAENAWREKSLASQVNVDEAMAAWLRSQTRQGPAGDGGAGGPAQ